MLFFVEMLTQESTLCIAMLRATHARAVAPAATSSELSVPVQAVQAAGVPVRTSTSAKDNSSGQLSRRSVLLSL